MAAAVHWGVLDTRNCLFIAASRIACIELAIVQLALLSVLICPEVASERVRAALRSHAQWPCPAGVHGLHGDSACVSRYVQVWRVLSTSRVLHIAPEAVCVRGVHSMKQILTDGMQRGGRRMNDA